jgi:hypothetical protein
MVLNSGAESTESVAAPVLDLDSSNVPPDRGTSQEADTDCDKEEPCWMLANHSSQVAEHAPHIMTADISSRGVQLAGCIF